MYFTVIAHLNLDIKFSLKILKSIYSAFITFIVRKVDTYIKVLKNILTND